MPKIIKAPAEAPIRMAVEDERDFREMKREDLDRFIKADNEWMKVQPRPSDARLLK